MLATKLHPEEIKAVLRKRHGTVIAFAAARGIKPQGVSDYLRGRASAVVAEAIETELRADQDGVAPESMKLDDSAADSSAHRLNVGAR